MLTTTVHRTPVVNHNQHLPPFNPSLLFFSLTTSPTGDRMHSCNVLLARPALGHIALIAALAAACAPAVRPSQAAPSPEATQAPAESGLLPVRYDAATGKVFLTVPRLGEKLLYLNTLATGLGSTTALLDRGQLGDNAIVRFERRGARVFLIARTPTRRQSRTTPRCGGRSRNRSQARCSRRSPFSGTARAE